MGSMRLKVKKRIRYKKLKKFDKLRGRRRTRCLKPMQYIEPRLGKTLHGIQNFLTNRLCDRKINSRSYINDDVIQKAKDFLQVRDRYFRYLQSVVQENCACYSPLVTKDILESLSLQLEQSALMSCLQIDIYKDFMTKIISDIEKSTQEKQIHDEVKKLLPNSIHEENDGSNLPRCDEYSIMLPTADTRTDQNSDENENKWADQSMCDSQLPNQFPTCSEQYSQYSEPCPVSQITTELNFNSNFKPDDDDDISLTVSENNSNFSRNEGSIYSPQSEFSDLLQTDENFISENEELDYIPYSPSKPFTDDIPDSPNESQNLVEEGVIQSFGQNESVNEHLKGNETTQTVQSSQSGIGKTNVWDSEIDDLLTQSEEESRQDDNVEENEDRERNLTLRLEKMREFFNIYEEKENAITSSQPKATNTEKIPKKRQPKCSTFWKNEKIIQLYKVAILTSKLSYEKRESMRKLFVELFGEDSDEENEFENGSSEKFRASCTERISSWVVKHLMPFYNKKRIVGRDVFKDLGLRISKSIIDKVQYPDERTVKYFISKYFPPNRWYARLAQPQPPQPG